jgi:hypothetical protein
VPVFKKKTPEERWAEEAVANERRQREAAAREAAERRRQNQAFLKTPVGRARTAFANGDLVYQFSINVMNQQAVIIAMVGSASPQTSKDPTAILNSVCREGWDLVNSSFVFVEQGQQSRDKFLASGQNVAIKGETVGYYVFKRREENRVIDEQPAIAAPVAAPSATAETIGLAG